MDINTNASSLHRELVTESEQKLVSAIKANNVAALDALLHDDLLFIAPDGQVITKAMDLEAHRSGNIVVDDISSTMEQINLLGNTAIVAVVMETKGKVFQQPMEGRFRYLRVWQLVNGQCKVVAASYIALS